MGEITQLLRRASSGDSPARERLYELLYPELRKLARSRLRRSETITLLDTTALVHESYLRFLNARELEFVDRARFFAFAASVMRSIVVDAVRKRRTLRRGGAAEHVEFDADVADAQHRDESRIIGLNDALEELSAFAPRLAQVVEMRYFAGLGDEDIAAVLGVTERTVRRDWDKARALLYSALK